MYIQYKLKGEEKVELRLLVVTLFGTSWSSNGDQQMHAFQDHIYVWNQTITAAQHLRI
jgi:hypothetical protein